MICDECDLTVPTPKSLWKEAAYYIFTKQLQESEMPLSDAFFHSRLRGRSHPWADPEGGQGVRTPLKNYKNIGFPSYIDPDPLKLTKLSRPDSINGGHYRHASETPFQWREMAFHWWADDGPLLVAFRSTLHPIN